MSNGIGTINVHDRNNPCSCAHDTAEFFFTHFNNCRFTFMTNFKSVLFVKLASMWVDRMFEVRKEKCVVLVLPVL